MLTCYFKLTRLTFIYQEMSYCCNTSFLANKSAIIPRSLNGIRRRHSNHLCIFFMFINTHMKSCNLHFYWILFHLLD